LENGIDERISTIQYNPMKINHINENKSKFASYDILQKSNEKSIQLLFKQSEFHVWSGFKINNDVILIPNTKFVKDEILGFWLMNFQYWILKNCIIYRNDIDNELNKILIFNDIEDENTVKKAKELQSLEFEKAYDYDLLIEDVKEKSKN